MFIKFHCLSYDLADYCERQLAPTIHIAKHSHNSTKLVLTLEEESEVDHETHAFGMTSQVDWSWDCGNKFYLVISTSRIVSATNCIAFKRLLLVKAS